MQNRRLAIEVPGQRLVLSPILSTTEAVDDSHSPVGEAAQEYSGQIAILTADADHVLQESESPEHAQPVLHASVEGIDDFRMCVLEYEHMPAASVFLAEGHLPVSRIEHIEGDGSISLTIPAEPGTYILSIVTDEGKEIATMDVTVGADGVTLGEIQFKHDEEEHEPHPHEEHEEHGEYHEKHEEHEHHDHPHHAYHQEHHHDHVHTEHEHGPHKHHEHHEEHEEGEHGEKPHGEEEKHAEGHPEAENHGEASHTPAMEHAEKGEQSPPEEQAAQEAQQLPPQDEGQIQSAPATESTPAQETKRNTLVPWIISAVSAASAAGYAFVRRRRRKLPKEIS